MVQGTWLAHALEAIHAARLPAAEARAARWQALEVDAARWPGGKGPAEDDEAPCFVSRAVLLQEALAEVGRAGSFAKVPGIKVAKDWLRL